MKKILVYVWLAILLCGVALILWYNQYVYSLPTPVPAHYHPVKNGAVIRLDEVLNFNNGKPVLLHFFNPDCPCSRFNVQHLKTLIGRYNGTVNFAVVLMTDKYYTPQQVKDRFNLQVPVVVNPALAYACGVYSTPQAAILKADHQLYYRGNYNSSRYCTNPRTEYARLALDGLLQHKPKVFFGAYATTAYGCSLPNHFQ